MPGLGARLRRLLNMVERELKPTKLISLLLETVDNALHLLFFCPFSL